MGVVPSSREPEGRPGRNAAPAANELVDARDRHVHPPGRLGLAHRDFSQKQLEQDDAGMRRATA